MIKYRWVILSLLLFATTINYKLPENHKKVDQEELAYIKSDQDFSPASAENKISHLQLINTEKPGQLWLANCWPILYGGFTSSGEPAS
ncbi:MAG: hypothetical protein V5A47_10240 [Bacteroidales bacterium]